MAYSPFDLVSFIFFLVLQLAFSAALGLIPAFWARRKGRRFWLWWLYGTVLFVVAVPHLIVLTITERRGSRLSTSIRAAGTLRSGSAGAPPGSSTPAFSGLSPQDAELRIPPAPSTDERRPPDENEQTPEKRDQLAGPTTPLEQSSGPERHPVSGQTSPNQEKTESPKEGTQSTDTGKTPEPDPQMKACPTCLDKNPVDAKTCKLCGARLTS